MATFSHGLPGSSTGRRGCSLCVGRLRRQVSQRSINLVMSRLIPGHQMALVFVRDISRCLGAIHEVVAKRRLASLKASQCGVYM